MGGSLEKFLPGQMPSSSIPQVTRRMHIIQNFNHTMLRIVAQVYAYLK